MLCELERVLQECDGFLSISGTCDGTVLLRQC